jgi:Ca2+-binding RTX toxin-like protein
LGVSAVAIAGAIAEENQSIWEGHSLMPGGFAGVGINRLLDEHAASYTHQQILNNYNLFYTNPTAANAALRELPGASDKYFNPALIDIGAGNIKLATAIGLLRNYQTSSAGNDQLGLSAYYNNYQSLAEHLATPEGTAQFAGLMIKEAQAYFIDHLGATRWDGFGDAKQEGLLITYYNLGKEKIEANRLAAGDSWDPQVGDGGLTHLDPGNRDKVIDAVNHIPDELHLNLVQFVLDIPDALDDFGRDIGNQLRQNWDAITRQFDQLLENARAEFFTTVEQFFQLSLRPNRDPLVLDLGPDGITFKSMAQSGVYFDMDNDGVKEQTGWITKEDGFLAIDENNNGKIDNVSELIGDPGRSGFTELATYDKAAAGGNNDGIIDSRDAVWTKLRVWRDLNENAVTDAGELQTLAANGVTSFGLNFTVVNFTAAENLIHEQGHYVASSGQQRQLVDAWLQTDSVNTRLATSVVPSAAAAALPDVRGYGTLQDLQQAMTTRPTLLSLVQNFVGLAPQNFGEVHDRVEAILFNWADAAGINPASRGGFFDARKLAAMEAVVGTPWVQQGSNPAVTNPQSFQVPSLTNAWERIVDEYSARLLILGPLKVAFPDTAYTTAGDEAIALRTLDFYLHSVDALTPTADPRVGALFWAEAAKALTMVGQDAGVPDNTIRTTLQQNLHQYGLDQYIDRLQDRVTDLRGTFGGTREFSNQEVALLGDGPNTVTIKGSGAAVFSGGSDDLIQSQTSSASTFSGGAGNDVLLGNQGSDFLDGGPGADWMQGFNGDDTYVVDNINDVVIDTENNTGGGTDEVRSSISYTLAGNLERLTLIGAASIDGTGNALNNILTGNSAPNTLRGGLGDDTYVVDPTDTVIENQGEGRDTVQVSGSYVVPANVEILWLLGTGDFNVTGNAADNEIHGNAGNNRIDGGPGRDAMYGGPGDDVYLVDNSSDYTAENPNEGNDTVIAQATFSLYSYVENLSLAGTDDIDGNGNDLANLIIGNPGRNHIDGRTGADDMRGGAGDDIYEVDNAGDIVRENPGEGTDTIRSNLAAYTMPGNVENLEYTGGGSFAGTGNAGNNRIVGGFNADTLAGGDGDDRLEGNSGADTLKGEGGNDYLDGGPGADLMIGGLGDDTYVLDDQGDVIQEGADGGNDTIMVRASIFAMPANIENVTLLEGGSFDVNGNSGPNTLIGNNSNNVLDGQGGIDRMVGGGGDDTYLVDNLGDSVFEAANGGTDLVKSSVNFALSSNFENLTLIGSTAVYATGNELRNTLIGNGANNIIVGGAEADIMTGMGGSDTFMFLAYDGTMDRVTDFTIGAGGDRLDFGKFLLSVGYTGSNPLADNVLRIQNNGFAVVQYNTAWGTTATANWQSVVQLDNVTSTQLSASGQIGFSGSSNTGPFIRQPFDYVAVNPGDQLRVVLGADVADDYDSATVTWSAKVVGVGGQLSPLPSWLVFNPLVPALFGTTSSTFNNLSIRFTATDERGATASFDTNIEITGNQVIAGTASADLLRGFGGDDVLQGLGGNDEIDGGTGRDVLSGGAAADRFVFSASSLTEARSAIVDRITDFDQGNSGAYNAAEGDQIDLSALLATAYNHGSGQAVASLVRAVEDVSGTFAHLQIDPDGAANGANWTTIARLDGLQPGNALNIILDSTLPGGSAIGVSNAFFGQPAVKLAAFNPANGWTSQDAFHRELADVNGDGNADIVAFGNPGVMVSLANGDGSFGAPVTKLAAFNPANGWTSDNAFHRELADVNGDHMADIVGFGNGGVYVALATGGGNFATAAIKLTAFNPANGWTNQEQFPRELGDVNGDGMADIIGFGNGGVYVSLATGGGNFAPFSIKLAAFNPGNGWTSLDQFPRELADVNGDGMADIVGFGNGGAYVALATGGGNFATPFVGVAALNPGNGWTSNHQFLRELADVNGDHMADIVGFGNGGVYVAVATGGGHFASPIIDVAAFNPINGWTSDDAFHREVADVNHDGSADIVGFGNPGVLVALANDFHLI